MRRRISRRWSFSTLKDAVAFNTLSTALASSYEEGERATAAALLLLLLLMRLTLLCPLLLTLVLLLKCPSPTALPAKLLVPSL